METLAKRSTRSRPLRIGLPIATLILVLGASPHAQAGDLCLDSNATYVFKRFKIPPAGRCRSLSGFEGSGSSRPGITGSACTWSDGSRVDFTFTSMALINPPPDTQVVAREHFARIDLPSLTGTDYERQSDTSSGKNAAVVGPCQPAVVPLP